MISHVEYTTLLTSANNGVETICLGGNVCPKSPFLCRSRTMSPLEAVRRLCQADLRCACQSGRLDLVLGRAPGTARLACPASEVHLSVPLSLKTSKMAVCHHSSTPALAECQNGTPGREQNEVGRNTNLIQELCVGLSCSQSHAKLRQQLCLVDLQYSYRQQGSAIPSVQYTLSS